MAIVQAAVYRIQRDGPVAPVKIESRDSLIEVSGLLDELFRDFKSKIAVRAGKLYGGFGRESSPEFENWLRQSEEGGLAFDTHADNCINHLKVLLENTEVEVGGFVLCVREKLADSESLFWLFAEQSEVVYLDGDLNLQTSYSLDKSSLYSAVKVDLLRWAGEDDRGCLTISKAVGNSDLTSVIEQWVGFSDEVDSKEETVQFLEAVTEITSGMEEQEAKSCRSQVVDYCIEQSKKGEPVVIRDLAEHVESFDVERVESAMKESTKSESGTAGGPEFIYPDRAQLKQYVRISGRSDLLSMSFDAECLGQSVIYDRDSDSLVINDPPGPLKQRILTYLRQQSAGQEA